MPQETKKVSYVLGLCLSTTSVGWSVLETDETGIPFRIAGLGVRAFKEAKTNYKRSKYRTSRRRLQRKACRKSRVMELFERIRQINLERIRLIKKEDLFGEEGIFVKSGFEKDVIILRKEGLDRKLENDEWARVLYNFTQRRGYITSAAKEISTKKIAEESKKQNSKSNFSNDDKIAQEEAKRHVGLLAAVKSNAEELKKGNYRTIGEMFCSSKDERFVVKDGSNREIGRTTRNKHGIYNFAVSRELIKDEISKLFDAQRKQGNKFADKPFQEEYESIVFSHYDKPQDLRGNCFFEKKGEKCAFKAGYTFEYFKLLCELNNIRIISTESRVDKAVRKITKSQRDTIVELYKTSPRLAPKDLSKKLNLKSGEYLRYFNTKQMQSYHEIREALNKVTENVANDLSNEQFDKIGEILSLYKNDDERCEKLKELLPNVGLGNNDLENAEILRPLLKLNFSGTGSLSLKAMKNLIPKLKEGLSYGEACEKVYSDHCAQCSGKREKYLSFEKLRKDGALDSINSPIVARAITQAFKVINAVIHKYGSPQSVHIELSRDIKCSSKTRERIVRDNEANRKRREKLINEVEKIKKQNNVEKVKVTEQEILKLQLYKDQNGKCLYSGKELDKNKLFSDPNYAEIDHIIPYSQSFDNSEANKVLTLPEENRHKGNEVPIAYILRKHKGSEEEYEAFVKRVKSVTKEVSNANKDRQKILEKRKQNLLISPNFKVDELEGLLVREAVGVQNIQKKTADILRNYLAFSDEETKQPVVVTKRSITEAICEQLGLQDRYNNVGVLSSALSAILIAVTPANYEAKMTEYVEFRESKYTDDGYIDPEDGKKMTIEEFDAKYMPKATSHVYGYLKKEVEIWMSSASGTKGINDKRKKLKGLYKEEFEGKYEDEVKNWKPIFVSQMPDRKISGQAHTETIRSTKVDVGKNSQDRISVITKTPLTSLKLKDGEIENYYMPSSDRLLYEELKNRLKAYGSAEQAFKEPVYKPKKDGSKGPRVYKVKTCKYESRGKYVEINDCNMQSRKRRKRAVAKKGDIVRIDIFHITGGKDQGYYFVPIYVADTIKNTLPKHAVVNSESSKVEWKEMKDSNFVFSLYKGDLIHIKLSNNCKDKDSDNKMRKAKDMYVYYDGVAFYQSDKRADQSIGELNGAINASWHDGSCEDSIRSEEIDVLEKYEVDVLGNYHKVRLPEKRQAFNLKYSQKRQ